MKYKKNLKIIRKSPDNWRVFAYELRVFVHITPAVKSSLIIFSTLSCYLQFLYNIIVHIVRSGNVYPDSVATRLRRTAPHGRIGTVKVWTHRAVDSHNKLTSKLCRLSRFVAAWRLIDLFEHYNITSTYDRNNIFRHRCIVYDAVPVHAVFDNTVMPSHPMAVRYHQTIFFIQYTIGI
jgi:hypothetical protein